MAKPFAVRAAGLVLVLLVLPMAGLGPATRPEQGPGEPAAAPASRRLPAITWDASTVQLVARGGSYGRMARLADGRIACVYDRDGRIWIRHGEDGGGHWADPIQVAEEEGCWLTNADLLVLRSGTLLYFWNERPRIALEYQGREPPPGALVRPFRIRMSASRDQGQTWSVPRTLHEAGVRFEDGCWEPAGVELPTGEIRVYFADESPFRASAEQQITMLRSHDGGLTWSPPRSIAFREKHRDGMPSPLVPDGGREIFIAIEDNGYAGGRFKPVIVSMSLVEDAQIAPVGAESPRRWGALAEPLDPKWYGGAPWLRQLPSGETLLSFQESESGELAGCWMAVCVGDRNARGFTHKSYPFAARSKSTQAWNSLFIKDARTVTAVSSTTIDGVRGIWAVDGRVQAGGRVREYDVSPERKPAEPAAPGANGDNSGSPGQ